MKKLLIIPAVIAAVTVAFTSCDDDVSTVGAALITDQSEIIIDSAFTAQGHSVLNTSVQSRTITQLIGKLQAKGYGTLSSEIVTQFMPAVSLDTAGVGIDDIESMEMLMFFTTGAFTGDSLAPMGLKVYPLTKELPSPIYSNFDPTGYYDPNNMWDSKIYTGNALYNDSLNNLSYRTISVSLPLEFAKSFYKEYLTNQSTFATPTAFAKFFPGLYITNSFGEGRITNIRETRINMHYRKHSTYTKNDTVRDTIYQAARVYMAVTPEVITNNIIHLSLSDDLTQRVAGGQSILVAPTGYDVEMTFPAKQLLDAYRKQSGQLSVINTLTMTIPAEEITNDYGIDPPNDVLIVLKKDKDTFFAKNQLADSKTSFLATYDATNKCYSVTGMRDYMLMLLEKSSLSADDYTFIITPVDVETETSQSSYYQSGSTYVVSITPYVSGPAMVKLNLEETKIKLTFGKQSTNF